MSRFPLLATSSQYRRVRALFASGFPCISLLVSYLDCEARTSVSGCSTATALELPHLAFSLRWTRGKVLMYPMYLVMVVEKDHGSSGRAVEGIFGRILKITLD